MRPVSYTYKGKTRTHFGLIADDLYELLQTDKYSIWSKLKDEQATQAIQTQEFIGVFIKSIQELYQLIQGAPVKPPLVRQQAVDIQEHKCNNIELINSLEVKLNELDNSFEELVEENSILKVKNSGLEKRVAELESKIDNIQSKDDNLLTEDGEDSMFDIMNKRMIDLENRLIKTEKKNTKLVTTINKMLKDSK